MQITQAEDARTFVADWVNEVGKVPSGVLNPVIEGLTQSLAIMDAAPHRYTEGERADCREALAYLTEYRDEQQHRAI